MNKPVAQLDLIPTAPTSADTKPSASSLDPKLIADLGRANVDPDLIGRVASATTAAVLVDRVLATAGPNPESYDWSSDNPDLLVPCQPATNVYWNPYNQVVIRQRAEDCDENDPYVLISRTSIPVVIAKLQQMLKEGP